MASKNQWANYFIFLSQFIFTNTIGLIYLLNLNDKLLDVRIIALGYLLLAISFLALFIPIIINKLKGLSLTY